MAITKKNPQTRFDVVSKSVGYLIGGLTTLVVGLVASVAFHWSGGASVMLTGACLAIWGTATLMGGMAAATKVHQCPKCGTHNAMLSSVKEFACMVCRTPYALKQAAHQLPRPHLPHAPAPLPATGVRSGHDRRQQGIVAAERTFVKALKGQDQRQAERRH